MLGDVCELTHLNRPSDLSACGSLAVTRHFHGDQLKGELGVGNQSHYLKRGLYWPATE